jgi:hypothetical protein
MDMSHADVPIQRHVWKYDFILPAGAEGLPQQNMTSLTAICYPVRWSISLAMTRLESKEGTNITTQWLF